MRDYQRQKVYDWESENIAKFDNNPIPFEQVQKLIDYIWNDLGYEYPPFASLLGNNVTSKCADALRTDVRFKSTTHTWVILHELAHVLTTNVDGESELHGPKFVGAYMMLVEKYMKIPISMLMFSANKEKVDFGVFMGPKFLNV